METLIKTAKVLYTAKTHTTGGRGHGASKSSDDRLDIKLSTPGTNGTGTNPEQLFAAGWSACFEDALATAARKRRLTLPEETAIDAEVDLCIDKGKYLLQARLNINLSDLNKELARELIDEARRICPYSRAIEGNVNVEYNLADSPA